MESDYPELNLPAADLRISDGKVWDRLRGKWVRLTPEEWVRQNFTAWLIDCRHYPAALTANETGIRVNDTLKRCDTVVFGRDRKPLIIVEYKAPDVKITQDVFDQIVRYNMALKARYLIVSNGLQHYCCRIDYTAGSYHFIPMIPMYEEIATPFSES